MKISESNANSEEFYYYSKGRIDKVIKKAIFFIGFTETYHYEGETFSYTTFSRHFSVLFPTITTKALR